MTVCKCSCHPAACSSNKGCLLILHYTTSVLVCCSPVASVHVKHSDARSGRCGSQAAKRNVHQRLSVRQVEWAQALVICSKFLHIVFFKNNCVHSCRCRLFQTQEHAHTSGNVCEVCDDALMPFAGAQSDPVAARLQHACNTFLTYGAAFNLEAVDAGVADNMLHRAEQGLGNRLQKMEAAQGSAQAGAGTC